MGATTDTWVNDARAQPWLFVTAEANDSLLSMLEKEILPAVRAQVGRQRRLTVVFDREGWSPKRFRRWAEEGIEVMTYRKGRYQAWPEEESVPVQDPRRTQGGSPVVYRLAERDLRIGSGQGVKLREVRRLCDNRHQTSIVTTCRDLPMEEVAYRAENAMLPGVGLLKREAEEGRAFLKTLFQTPADLIPLEEEKQLLVRYHSMAQRRFNTALRTLCHAATLGSHRYPGTDLRLIFQGPSVTNETDPGQEV